jgi:hypothetical protein
MMKNGVWFLVSLCVVMLFSVTVSFANETGEHPMQMVVHANGQDIVFALNESPASKSLLVQLPMEIAVENYGNNEKIFSPPKKLNTSDTPLAGDVRSGTLAYYAPWGDVVMFYGSFHSAPGLYELGHAVQGGEYIRELSGMIMVAADVSQ